MSLFSNGGKPLTLENFNRARETAKTFTLGEFVDGPFGWTWHLSLAYVISCDWMFAT